MTEYTPTTERVRAAYSNYLAGLTREEARAELLALEFDRWSAKVKDENWRELRGHLVDDFDNHPDTFWAEDGDGNQVEVISLSSVIKLVNGEYGMGEEQ